MKRRRYRRRPRSCGGFSPFVTTPLAERLQELLDGLFLRPEVAMKARYICDWAGALACHKLLDGRVPRRGITHGFGSVLQGAVRMLAVPFGHDCTSTS